MRELTPKEKEELQAMIDEQNRERERRHQDYLRRKMERGVAERVKERGSSGLRNPIVNPPLESTVHRAKYYRGVKHSKLRRIELTEEERKDLKDKAWETIQERHEARSPEKWKARLIQKWIALRNALNPGKR
jgi:hypothetical protein